MRVLIVEDDKPTADFIARGLAGAGHESDQAHDGKDGLHKALAAAYDALIVDRMLPSLPGLDLIGSARAEGVRTPILILTAIDDIEERVAGLNAGADDYLVKPFAFSELLARLNALIRRPPLLNASADIFRIADLELEPEKRRVARAGKRIDLTAQEFKLLEYLVRRKGETVTRTMLLEDVWGLRFDPRTNVVEAHMSRLRAKIDSGYAYELIRTQRGIGYVIDDQA